MLQITSFYSYFYKYTYLYFMLSILLKVLTDAGYFINNLN